MPYTPVELMLVKGRLSGYSYGYPTTGTPTDPAPTTIDLLTGVFTVFDQDGKSTFSPVIANIKNGGVWIDSATMEGRQLVAAQKGNVLETVLLRAPQSQTVMQRAAALSRINAFAAAASDYWASGGASDSVYLRFQAPGAPGEQYALIYSIEIDDDDDGLNPEGNGTLTMTIEREPAWRPIPPGAPPKIWTLQWRGLIPYPATGAAPADEYNWNDLHLINSGSGLKTHLHQGTVKRVDELGLSNINYAIIPAESIPGDAPALAWIHASAANVATHGFFARSSRRDLFASSVTDRQRYTFGGVDSNPVGGGGLTASKVADATYGLTNSFITPTRQVLRAANLAAGFAETQWAYWGTQLSHISRRWRVYARIKVTAGSAPNHTMRVGLANLNTIVYSTSRKLTGVGATPSLLYIGEIDASSFVPSEPTGSGVFTNGALVYLYLTKTNDGAASTVELIDLVFLPLDEPNVKVANNASGATTVGVDSSGYFNLHNEPVPYGLSNSGYDRVEAQGQIMTLVPGVANTIIYLDNYVGASFQSADIDLVIDIVPRWYGIRDV